MHFRHRQTDTRHRSISERCIYYISR